MPKEDQEEERRGEEEGGKHWVHNISKYDPLEINS